MWAAVIANYLTVCKSVKIAELENSIENTYN